MNRRALAVAVTAVVAVAVAAGFLAIGSPGDERARRADETRLEHLQRLRVRVADEHRRRGRLPADLERIVAADPELRDPVTADAYGYEAIDEKSFRLCATFDFASPADAARRGPEDWAHRSGRQCFRFEIGQVEGRDPQPLRPIPEEGDDSSP